MNYLVEIYDHDRRVTIMSQDLNEVGSFLSKHLPEVAQQAALELLSWQAQNGKFPNVVYFLNVGGEPISIEEFLNGCSHSLG